MVGLSSSLLLLALSRAAAQEPLLALDLTVDGKASRLVLREGQAYVDAARQACASTTEPFATDNCVSGAVTLIVQQHLQKKENATTRSQQVLASPGVSLVRDGLANYDPLSFEGKSPLHVDIELPIQTRRTVCDSERCWELDETGQNHTLRVPAWAFNATEAAGEVASVLDLWRAEDLALLESRVALERTRKATPVDPRLRRRDGAVVSFDGFYPPYFVLHTASLFFDAQRVKVAGAFHPPDDGDVCVTVASLNSREQQASSSSSAEDDAAPSACFDRSYNAQLTGFAEAQGVHKLSVRLRQGDSFVGEGDESTFVAAPPLLPKADEATTESKFLRLLRNAVAGWLYLENAGDDPGAAGPLTAGWTGHTMVGVHKLDWLHAMIQGLDGVEGDLVECGAWRGGASIYMKGVAEARFHAGAAPKRRVLVADTFRGFPKAKDAVDTDGWAIQNFAVGGADAVRATFARYGLLDEDVFLLEGFFHETLPSAPTSRIALLRLDCDMYRSTLDALEALYDRIAPGGIVVHNNWQYTSARAGLLDFRRARNLEYLPLHLVDANAMAFVKE